MFCRALGCDSTANPIISDRQLSLYYTTKYYLAVTVDTLSITQAEHTYTKGLGWKSMLVLTCALKGALTGAAQCITQSLTPLHYGMVSVPLPGRPGAYRIPIPAATHATTIRQGAARVVCPTNVDGN